MACKLQARNFICMNVDHTTRAPHSTFSYVQYKVKGKNVTAARVEKSKQKPTSLRIWILVCRDSVSPVFSLSLHTSSSGDGWGIFLTPEDTTLEGMLADALLTHVRGKQTPTVLYGVKYFCKLYWKDFGAGRGVHFGEQLNWKKTMYFRIYVRYDMEDARPL